MCCWHKCYGSDILINTATFKTTVISYNIIWMESKFLPTGCLSRSCFSFFLKVWCFKALPGCDDTFCYIFLKFVIQVDKREKIWKNQEWLYKLLWLSNKWAKCVHPSSNVSLQRQDDAKSLITRVLQVTALVFRISPGSRKTHDVMSRKQEDNTHLLW